MWHQRRSGRKLIVTVEPLRELTAPQLQQLDDEANLVGAVMEALATLTVGPATVGPHAWTSQPQTQRAGRMIGAALGTQQVNTSSRALMARQSSLPYDDQPP